MKQARKKLTRETCDEGQLRCWTAASWVFGGDHHVPRSVYECGYGIQFSVTSELATHDGNLLTRLVAIAHATQVRVAIGGGGPYRTTVTMHPRDPAATSLTRGHPTIETLIEYLRRFETNEKGGA